MGVIVDSLLAKGYFPKELPPPFSTTGFAAFVSGTPLPTNFRSNTRTTRMLTHSLARPGNARRRLGIPNPLTYLMLCEAIEANIGAITTHINQSNFSQSKPVSRPMQARAYKPNKSLGDLIQLRADARATGSVLLRADLSNFYHSIYSHSIPWAIHTKATAKNNRSNSLYGNVLDQRIRNMQDGQTIGIPVGPDSSLIIAEIIAAAIDVKANATVPGLRGFRYYDDYEFSFNSVSEAETSIAQLELIVSEYELHLHPSKTTIVKLPQPLEQEWVATLRALPIRDAGQGQRVDLLNYFDHLFALIQKFPSEHVVSFAIARLVDALQSISDWALVEPLLFQAVLAQPNALPEFFYCIVASRDEGNVIDNSRLEELLNQLIVTHAPLNHGSEVAWSLWGILAFDLRVRSSSAAKLGSMDDSIVALLALNANSSSRVDPGLDLSMWSSLMQADELLREQWLLAYEANIHNWLPTVGGGDHVANDQNFGHMKNHNIRFYQPVIHPVTLNSLSAWKPNPGDYK